MRRRDGSMRQRHRRLGDLVGEGLLLGADERITVNQVGGEIQLVRIGADLRAQAEVVPSSARDDIAGWISTAERTWRLRGLVWRFESVAEIRARWRDDPRAKGET